MDTQAMVQQLMRAESMRMERLTRRRTMIQWRQESIRGTQTHLNEFRAQSTDFLRSGTITNDATWNTIKSGITAIGGGTGPAGVSVVSTTQARMGSFDVHVQQVAQGDLIRGDRDFQSRNYSTSDVDSMTVREFLNSVGITATGSGGEQRVDINGVGIFVRENETMGTFMTRVNNSAAGVNMRFNQIRGAFEIEHKSTGADAMVRTGDNDLLRAMGLDRVRNVTESRDDFLDRNIFDLTGLDAPQSIPITIGGTTHPLVIDIGLGDTVQTFLDRVNSILSPNGAHLRFGVEGNVSDPNHEDYNPLHPDFGRFILSAGTGGAPVSVSFEDSGIWKELGFGGTTLTSLQDELPVSQRGNSFIANTLGGEVYDGTRKRIATEAQNAVVWYGGPPNTQGSFEIIQSSNVINIHGHNVTLSSNMYIPEGENVSFTINAERDITDVMESIKGFVEQYNELIRHINSLHSTARPRAGNRPSGAFFEPLTDEQRNSMSDREVERWEEQAKTGLLHRDSDIRQLHDQLRNAMFNRVNLGDGRHISMHEIGITTVGRNGPAGDQMIGVLQIDENALRAALEERGDEVKMLFARTGMDANQANARKYRYNDDLPDNPPYMNSSTIAQRNYRAPEVGLGFRIDDILRTFAQDDDGPLRQRAGYTSGLMTSENTMSRQIRDYSERISRMESWLQRRENHYYAMFAKMEAAMQQSHSQMDALFAFATQ